MNNLYFRSLIEMNQMIEIKNYTISAFFRMSLVILLFVVAANKTLHAQEPQLPDTTLACFADSTLLDAGEGFQSYLWNTNEQTQTIWARDTGWYSVLCTQASMEVIKDSTWVFMQNAGIDQADTIYTCYTYPITLCVEPDTLKYVWTSNDPDLFIDYDTAACVDVTPIHDTTTVYVHISDSAGILTCVDSVQIWLYPRMTFKEINQINMGCPGTCKGQLQVVMSGGKRPYSYIWPTTTPVQYDSIVFGLCETDYVVEVTDQYMCVRDTSLPVEVFDMPEVEIIRDPDGNIYIQNPVVTFSYNNLSLDSILIIDNSWDFGDSTYSKDTSHVKVFDQVRAFDVWLKYTTDDECIDSVTMNVDVGRVMLTVPNVFTPNGDQYNELFAIDSLENYMSNEIKIFNRYGKKVFSKKNYAGDWDGENLRDGVYFYVLEAEGYFGTDVFRGSITIMR
jgi:gliding motility-associated-like protein